MGGAEPLSREPWNTGAALAARICRAKSLDKRFTDYPLAKGKGQLRLSLLPARTGPGGARDRGQGDHPLAGS